MQVLKFWLNVERFSRGRKNKERTSWLLNVSEIFSMRLIEQCHKLSKRIELTQDCNGVNSYEATKIWKLCFKILLCATCAVCLMIIFAVDFRCYSIPKEHLVKISSVINLYVCEVYLYIYMRNMIFYKYNIYGSFEKCNTYIKLKITLFTYNQYENVLANK